MGEYMKKGKICFKWNDVVVGQIVELQGNMVIPLVPFRDEQPMEEKFLFAPLENKLDVDALRDLYDKGHRWMCFSIKDYLEQNEK